MKPIQAAIIWVIMTCFVTYTFCLNTAGAVFSDVIKSSLHVTDLGAAIATGSFIAGFACMQIPAGYLLDKYNPKWVVGSGVALLAIGNLLISLANNLFFFSISNLIQGIGGSFAFVGAGVLIAQWFHQKYFPILFGLSQTVACFTVGVLHYLLTNLLLTYRWNVIYQYMAIFGGLLFIATLIFIKRPPHFNNDQSNISLKTSLGTVCRNPQIWLCAISAATSFGILMAYAGFWYLKIQTFYAVNVTDSLIISGLIFAGIGIGAPLLGVLSNIIRSRITVIHTSLTLGCMTLLLAIYLPHFNIQSNLIIYIISFLLGLFLSASELFYTVVSEISTNETRGVAMSFVNTGIFLLNTLMLFIPYYFITITSTNFFTYLWVLPFSIMLSVLFVYFVNESFKLSN